MSNVITKLKPLIGFVALSVRLKCGRKLIAPATEATRLPIKVAGNEPGKTLERSDICNDGSLELVPRLHIMEHMVGAGQVCYRP